MICAGSERAALAAVAWLCSAAYWPALTLAAATSTAEAPVPFDIAAQPMAQALNAWAVQANAQLFVDPAPLAHLTAPAVKGTLRPRQALRALLARSNLQFSQGGSGVFVIKPRAAVAVARAQAPPAPAPQVEAPEPPPRATPPAARASAGSWLLGAAAQYDSDTGAATGGATAGVRSEYFITDHVTAALDVSAPRNHSFEVPGSAGARASTQLQSSDVRLTYHLAPAARIDPYFGAGIGLTVLYGARGVARLDHLTAGAMIGAGLEFSLDPHWMLNADVSWTQVRPDAGTSPEQQIRIDPLRLGVGFGYRF